MKRQIITLLICSLLLTLFPLGYAEENELEEIFVPIIPIPTLSKEQIVITEAKSEESEKWLWDTLMYYTQNNEYITAGILAVFARETYYKSNAIAHYYELPTDKDHCQIFVDLIDAGLQEGETKEIFVHQCHYKNGGFGLTQVWSKIECESFYDFAQQWGTSIADAEMQCAWSVHYLQTQFPKIWQELLNSSRPEKTGGLTATWLDGASDTGQAFIVCKAVHLYEKYGTK